MSNLYDLYAGGCTGTIPAGTSLVNALQARTSTAVFYGLDGWTSTSGTVYIMVFDSNTSVSGSIGAGILKHSVQVSGPGNFGITIPPSGELFKNGIYILQSSSAPMTATAGATTAWFNCQSVLEGPGAT